MYLNQAVDQVRRAESSGLRAAGSRAAQKFKADAVGSVASRQPSGRTSPAKLNALLTSKLATDRAWELKEVFSHFWKYKSVMWAGGFLNYWTERALRKPAWNRCNEWRACCVRMSRSF